MLKEVDEARPKAVRRGNRAYDLDWNDYYDHDTLNQVQTEQRRHSKTSRIFGWKFWLVFVVHVQFLDALAEANDFAEVISIGQSYEGRDMKVLAVTKVGK